MQRLESVCRLWSPLDLCMYELPRRGGRGPGSGVCVWLHVAQSAHDACVDTTQLITHAGCRSNLLPIQQMNTTAVNGTATTTRRLCCLY